MAARKRSVCSACWHCRCRRMASRSSPETACLTNTTRTGSAAAHPAVSHPCLGDAAPGRGVIHRQRQLVGVVSVEHLDVHPGIRHAPAQPAELARSILVQALDQHIAHGQHPDADGRERGSRRLAILEEEKRVRFIFLRPDRARSLAQNGTDRQLSGDPIGMLGRIFAADAHHGSPATTRSTRHSPACRAARQQPASMQSMVYGTWDSHMVGLPISMCSWIAPPQNFSDVWAMILFGKRMPVVTNGQRVPRIQDSAS